MFVLSVLVVLLMAGFREHGSYPVAFVRRSFFS
jgi:hypothetical protein